MGENRTKAKCQNLAKAKCAKTSVAKTKFSLIENVISGAEKPISSEGSE
jgi:hypothetical protein